MKNKVMKQLKRAFVTAACASLAFVSIAANSIKVSAAETVPVRFFVLNRELSVPSEPCIGTYPSSNYSAGINGTISVNYAKPQGSGVTSNVGSYMVNVPSRDQLNSIGLNLQDYESVTWYVIKTEDDGIHVDGVINDQRMTITVKYGYLDDNNSFVTLAPTVSNTYLLGDSYSIASPVIEGYTPNMTSVTGVASKSIEYTVLYSKDVTYTVILNYYRSSVTGTLLGTSTVQVTEAQLAEYYSSIASDWVNLYKPTDCYGGTLVDYSQREDGVWVASIVYTPIPVTPVNSDSTATADPGATDYVASQVTIEDANVPTAAVPVADATTTTTNRVRTVRNTTPATTVTPVADDNQEEVIETPVEEVIEDTEVPLADPETIEEPKDDNEIEVNIVDATEIEDAEVPLSDAEADADCWIHWAALALTAAYSIFVGIRMAGASKQLL